MMVPMTSPVEPASPRWLDAWTEDEGERRARARMREVFGVDADGVWSAPGRLTIIGEYTDFGGGMCLPTVIPHRTYVAARLRDDDVVRITTDSAKALAGAPAQWEGTLDSLETAVQGRGWVAYPAGVLWALQERGFSGRGVDLAISSCVPIAAGLSSSGALTGATALAINAVWKLSLKTDVDAVELAEVCIDAKNDVAGGATGGLDQHAIMRCRPGEALHLDFGVHPTSATPCPLYFPDYGLALLLIYTGVPHDPPAAAIRQRMSETKAAEAALGVACLRDLQDLPDALARIEALADETLRKRARHVYTENERVGLVRDDLSGTAPAHERFVSVGKAMYRSHASLETDFEMSSDALNLAVDTAFRTGALGARMVGAGGGGSAAALIRRAQATSIAATIDQEFTSAGRPRPSFALL